MIETNSDEWLLSAHGAQVYDDVLVPAIFAPWVAKTVDAAQLNEGQAVLDVACGTGIVADAAVQRVGPGGTVVGIDINPDMLAVAVTRRSGQVEWAQGDAMSLPYPGEHFDRVMCQLGLQYFADPALALSEMHRVLRFGGRVAVMLWRDIRHSPGFALLAELIGDQLGTEVGESMRGPFAFGDDECRLRKLLESAGFDRVTTRIATDRVRFSSVKEFVGHQLAASPLESLVELGESWTATLTAKVLSAFSLGDADEPIIFPIEAYLATGHRDRFSE